MVHKRTTQAKNAIANFIPVIIDFNFNYEVRLGFQEIFFYKGSLLLCLFDFIVISCAILLLKDPLF